MGSIKRWKGFLCNLVLAKLFVCGQQLKQLYKKRAEVLNTMRDSYERFFLQGYITKEQFFEFGLRETIYAPLDKAEVAWSDLKANITNNHQVYMRGFGRNSKGTHLFQDFYRHVLNNEHVTVDPTNNAQPTKLIRELTGYSKTKSSSHKSIQNYQVSHIFGRTKNVFAFTAPWNIVYIPKILDPFTGHEAKGEIVGEYQMLFKQQGYEHFEPLIEDYNNLITSLDLNARISDYLDKVMSDRAIESKVREKLSKAIIDELSPISL